MKIAVVIPLYNKRKAVLNALNSVLNQTVLPDEIIVVNDGSTDGSEQVIAELNHPLVRLINQSNLGVSAARNRGIAESNNEWIAFLDADDEWLPEFLETITGLSKKYPQCSVLATSYFLKDQAGNRRQSLVKKLPFSGKDGLLTNYFIVSSCSEPPIHSSAVIIKKTSLESVGGFPVSITSGEDLLTWAGLAVNNKIGYTRIPMSVFVLDAAHTYSARPSRIPQNPDTVGKELAKLAKQNIKIPGIKYYVANWHKMRSSIYLRLGKRKKAFCEMLKSLSFRLFNVRIFAYFILLLLPVSLSNKIFKRFGTT